MNNKPNTTEWKKGDIVIHDADIKRADMLMEVVSVDKENKLWKTKYLYQKGYKTARFINELKYLHSPARFGIIIDEDKIYVN